LLGRLLNSGWNCTPMKKRSPGISTVSTSRPSVMGSPAWRMMEVQDRFL
jgi:hypothetical protein